MASTLVWIRERFGWSDIALTANLSLGREDKLRKLRWNGLFRSPLFRNSVRYALTVWCTKRGPRLASLALVEFRLADSRRPAFVSQLQKRERLRLCALPNRPPESPLQ